MIELTTIFLEFNNTLSTDQTLNQFVDICNDYKQLTNFKIVGEFKQIDVLKFVEQVITYAK